jgi:hypothetical protein
MLSAPDPQLEALIDAELRALPPVEAPSTLVPNVLQALRARASLPWWRQAWWQWPFPARAGFVTAALSALAVVTGGGWFLETGLRAYSQPAVERLGHWTTQWGQATSLQGALGWLTQGLSQPWVLAGLAIAVGLYLACLGLGTLFVRTAWRRC